MSRFNLKGANQFTFVLSISLHFQQLLKDEKDEIMLKKLKIYDFFKK